MEQRKIHILYTGGTIGSSEHGGIIGPDTAMREYLIERYREVSGDVATEFTFDEPYYILSEYLDGTHINMLTDAITGHLNTCDEDTAGIIVTLGSDTVQYASAATALKLREAKIPVVFVLSNAILTLPEANGLNNFVHAVNYILGKSKESRLPAVTVSYQNPGEHPRLWDPLRLYPHLPFSGTLYESEKPFPKALELPAKDAKLSDPAPVLMLTPVPGASYPTPAEGTKAVLLATYHSGTMDTGSTSFVTFTKDMKDRGIRLFLLGAERDTQYESTEAYKELGITVLPEMSPVAAYLWLWYTL